MCVEFLFCLFLSQDVAVTIELQDYLEPNIVLCFEGAML